VVVAASVIAFWALALPGLIAERICPEDGKGLLPACGRGALRHAAAIAGGRAEYPLALARTSVAGSKETVHYLTAALRLNPTAADAWGLLGRALGQKREDPIAYLHRWMPLADRSFELAVHWAPADPQVLFDAASHWVGRSQLLAEEGGASNAGPDALPGSRAQAVARFQQLYRRAIALDPSLWEAAMERVAAVYPEDSVVLGILPDGAEELEGEVLREMMKKQSKQ
jgi:hypothetical protein